MNYCSANCKDSNRRQPWVWTWDVNTPDKIRHLPNCTLWCSLETSMRCKLYQWDWAYALHQITRTLAATCVYPHEGLEYVVETCTQLHRWSLRWTKGFSDDHPIKVSQSSIVFKTRLKVTAWRLDNGQSSSLSLLHYRFQNQMALNQWTSLCL